MTDHEIFAAFTLHRCGAGDHDGYQIGINLYGTTANPHGQCRPAGRPHQSLHSNVTQYGYTAQTARMIAVGAITAAGTGAAACTEGAALRR